jgi:tetratricopeptide (TPR) repeat protein
MPTVASPSPPVHRRRLPAAALAFLAAVVVYLPALGNDFVWNDADYVTKPALQPLQGLVRIWTEFGATEQYYPLLHTFFWVQHRLFGVDPLFYHLVNVLLHASCAALLVRVVRRLFQPTGLEFAPGRVDHGESIALLAGLIFAVHPVYVESVAWISEQKNTFSLLWYLLAGWVYLGVDEGRADLPSPPGSKGGAADMACPPDSFWRRRGYWLATFFFLLAILSKSPTATLPCALLVIVWWRHGRLTADRWVPMIPWLLAGAAMGAVTGWVEHQYIGARGEDFALGPVARGVLAGRVIWFYLGKYFWPAELIFIYPRWTVDPGVGWQWLFPAAAVGLLVGLWALRHRARGPLAAYLIFVGSLVPTLGFFNVYAFKFSYVADHWNYLPSLALAVSAAWGAVALAVWIGGRAGSTARPGSPRDRAASSSSQPYLRVTAAVVLVLLAVLSVRQIRGYRNIEIFYQTILRQNPDCWLAAHNLGGLRLDRGLYEEAVPYYEQALRARPGLTEALNNLGGVLQRLGRRDEAIVRFREAVRLAPADPDYHRNLGGALASAGRLDEAVVELRRAVELKPGTAELHRLLAQALFEAGRLQEAMAERAVGERLSAKP